MPFAGPGAGVGGLSGGGGEDGTGPHAAQDEPGGGHPYALPVRALGQQDGVARARRVHRPLDRVPGTYDVDHRNRGGKRGAEPGGAEHRGARAVENMTLLHIRTL